MKYIFMDKKILNNFSKIRKDISIKNKRQIHTVDIEASVLTTALYFWHELYFSTRSSVFIIY